MTDHEQPAAGVALKPCPFCGGLPEVRTAMGEYWVFCVCEATTSATSKRQSAVNAWNRRAAPTDAGGAVSEAMEQRLYGIAKGLGVNVTAKAAITACADELRSLRLAALSSPQPLQQGGEVTREQVEWLVRRAPGEEWRSTKDARVAEVAKDCGYEVLALFASLDLGDLTGLVADLEAPESSHERRHREDNLVNPDGPDAIRAIRSLAADRDKAVGLLRRSSDDLHAELLARYGDDHAHYPGIRRKFDADMEIVNEARAFLSRQTERR